MSDRKPFLATLTVAERKRLRHMGFAAVFVEAYHDRVPRTFGDNRGVWPTRIRSTTDDPDRRVRQGDYEDGVHGRGLIFCYWVSAPEFAQRLSARANAILTEHADQIRHAWHDAVPDGVDTLVQWAAMAEGIELWSETEVRAAVQAAEARDMGRKAGDWLPCS